VTVRAVVLDIEGTISPKTVVYDTLFPYARARLADWVHRPEAAEVVDEVRRIQGTSPDGAAPEPDLSDVVAALELWTDEDLKYPPLKTLQGLIWAEGFASGELHGVLYPDVPPILDAWHTAGFPLYVYSSGSELAQRLWLSHTPDGDLTTLITGHFDTRSAGPKTTPTSYQTISTAIDVQPPDIVFFSDAVTELDAARAAGWHTIGVSRAPDNFPDTGDHFTVDAFTDDLVK
jgi:enolase-phosphatase E1